MKCVKKFVILIFVLQIFGSYPVKVLRSPCKEVFEYSVESGIEVAYLTLKFYDREVIDLKVELVFILPEDDFDENPLLNMTLIQSVNEIIENISDGNKQLSYVIYFPKKAMLLSQIVTNEQFITICSNQCTIPNQFWDTRFSICLENNNRTIRAANYFTMTRDQAVSYARNLFKYNEGIDESCGVIDEKIKQRSWIGEIQGSNGRCLVVFVSKTRAVVSSYCIKTLQKNQDKDYLDDLTKVIIWNGERVKIRNWVDYKPYENIRVLSIWYSSISERISTICIPGHNEKPYDQRVFVLDSEYELDISNETIYDIHVHSTRDEEKNEQKNLQESGLLIFKKSKRWYIEALDVKKSSNTINALDRVTLDLFELEDRPATQKYVELVMKSPCPLTFQYGKYDDLYAAFIDLEVPLSDGYQYNITAEFYVPKNFVLPSNSTLNITVYDYKGEDERNEDFSDFFVILFPPKMIFPLKQITLKGNVVCLHKANQHIFRKSRTISGYYEFRDDPLKHLDDSSKVNRKTCGKLNSTFIKSDQHFNKSPWIARFVCSSKNGCSARDKCPIVLISTQLAIIDARCTNSIEFKHIKIFNDQSLKIRYFIRNPFSNQHIGLLFLETKIESPEFVPACMWKYAEDELENINGIWTRFNKNQIYSTNISTTTCPIINFEENNKFLFCIHSESKPFAHEEGLFFHKVDQWYIRGMYIYYSNSYYYFTDVSPNYNWITNYEETRALTSPCPKEFNYGKFNEQNVGLLNVVVPKSIVAHFDVNLEFFVPKREIFPEEGLKIDLEQDSRTVVRNILQKKAVSYLINFPENYLILMRIYVNGSLICENLDEAYKRISPSRKINVHHEFKAERNVLAEYRQLFKNQFNPVNCGNLNRTHQALSVGGEREHKNRWPWVASFYVKDEHQCSATLISKSIGITAAHCLFPGGVNVSVTDVKLDLFNNQKIGIWTYIKHPNYVGSTENDIAILFLDEDITSNDFVPICIWEFPNNNMDNRTGELIAYGATEFKEAGTLNSIEMVTASVNTCRKTHKDLEKLANENTFCAKGLNGIGPCKGDSGGGFVVKEGNNWYLRGVVSTSLINEYDQCDVDNYTVLMDVEKYLDWIYHNNQTASTDKVRVATVFMDVEELLDWIYDNNQTASTEKVQ